MSKLFNLRSAYDREGLRYVVSRAPVVLKSEIQSAVSNGIYKLHNPFGELSRADMVAKCEKSDQIWYYGSRGSLEITPPIIGPNTELFQRLAGRHEIPRPFVCELNDIRLVGHRALSRMSDGRFVLEEMGTTGMFKSRMSNTFDSFSPEETLREVTQPLATETGDYDYDTILNLVPRHGAEFNNYANFAHWLLEDLPRLRAYNYYSDATGEDVKLLLKRDPPAWMTDTLRCMGFQYTDWIEWDQQSARVKNLVVPRMSYIHSTGSQFAPASRRWVGETIRNGCGVETSEHPKRVFISRQKSDRRKITNFDEVMDELKPLGFRPYNLEDLTIEEEISLFSQADMIVGVHGAGLATTIYAEDITLLELFPHDVSATTYFILANEMGFDYGSFVAEAPDPNNKDNKKNLDLRVNTEELREAIVNIIPSNQ